LATIFSAMVRWQPMASMVTTVPLSPSASSSFGIAVISLDFIDLALPEHQVVGAGPGRNHVHQRLFATLARAAQRLAVDGDHFAHLIAPTAIRPELNR
jgi:hypothetical protein